MNHTPTPWQIEGKYAGDSGSLYLSTMHPMPVFELVPVVGVEAEHVANAAFIVTAVNAYEKQRALIETLSKTLSAVKTWAEQRCPCENDEPNPCPLCGASVENLEACKAVDQTFPRDIKRDIFAALAAAKEQSA